MTKLGRIAFAVLMVLGMAVGSVNGTVRVFGPFSPWWLVLLVPLAILTSMTALTWVAPLFCDRPHRGKP